MSSANSQVSMSRIADVLASVRKKGVTLWSENGRLHYRAPKGALAQDEIERLRASKSQIVALLEEATGAETIEPKLEPRPRLDRAPLAFSQVARWHLHRLNERRGIRQVASATRLRGRLNVAALQASVAEIFRRHDALRTRIVVVDGVPMQEISESVDSEIRVSDLTTISDNLREAEIIRIVEEHILEPVDFAVGPLCAVRLLRLDDDEHVFIVAMEHMISDGFSLNIVMRDLFAAYKQASIGHEFSLPEIPMQFSDYAVWQRNSQEMWAERHGEYWNERLKGCQRLRFPEDQGFQEAERLGWGTVPLRIGAGLKAELREWCRRRRTTLVMGVFTAYVGLVLRWCNTSESVIQYQSDCRVSPKIENTIGFFTSVLYLRIALLEGDTFADLMNRITQEYCKAYEHVDSSFIAAQVPRPELTRNTVFNWIPQGSKTSLADAEGSQGAILCSSVPFAHPMLRTLELDQEPFMVLYDTDDEIVGAVHFPMNRFSIETLERFGRNFIMFLEELLRQPEVRVRDILLR